jgi:serine/threonine protein kinase
VPEGVRTALGDGYEMLRPLGQGGMGTVYLAREIALDRLVAVKVLRSELAGDDRNVQRFLREARVAAKLRHPGIVSIHAVGSRGGYHFFTMDFLEGHTLDTWTRVESPGSGRVDPVRARAILADVARAVGQAHQHGIVHRDLKPSNIMLDTAGRVFVMDFGLARPRGSGELTTAGAIVGTPQYMSPEQIDGKPLTPRSDVYSLGLVYYFVLVGEHLVQGDTLSSMVALHLSGGCRARLLADARVPESERRLLSAMVEKEDDRRPASMEEVVRHLAGATSSAPRESRPPNSSGEVPGRPGSGETSSPLRRKARQRLGAILKKLEKKE